MSRKSTDELAPDGSILNGFDYNLQVWVLNGICEDVGMGRKYAGQKVTDIQGHETR
ncbi:hypothetical protein LCGC14_1641400 [marine sediment metagenome]|uniref:Uncharacterized protein n=1 Tax=marine sediment metagenome TaxID=412755 RepID=A0A0F9HZG3_9ZZZZ